MDMGHLNKGHIGLDQTMQSNSNRGIKMLHVGFETAAFAARWISRLLSPSKPHWKSLVMSNIRNATEFPLEVLLHCKIPKKVEKAVVESVSPVWKLAFQTWFKNRPVLQTDFSGLHIQEILSMPIFFNPLITTQGDMIQRQNTHGQLWWVGQLYTSDLRIRIASEIIGITKISTHITVAKVSRQIPTH
jgi:hypothetical protein